jgi:hypothetical protein
VFVVDKNDRLEMSDSELQALSLPVGPNSRIGEDRMCLALVSTLENGATTVNLLAPRVARPATREGAYV